MDRKIMIIGIIAAIAMVSVGGYVALSSKGTPSSTGTTVTPPTQTQTEVQIPVSELSTNAKFYTYDDSGVTIRYFVVKDTGGTVHVALDACDVCYAAKKGYQQVGDVMQCLNCGRQFSITSIGTENTAGGCWPSYLPMKIDGNNVVINIADLQAKSFMF